jgi:hypothetical protein
LARQSKNIVVSRLSFHGAIFRCGVLCVLSHGCRRGAVNLGRECASS